MSPGAMKKKPAARGPRPAARGRKNKVARVFLVDDHPLMREGFAGILRSQPDLEVCGETGSAAEALERVEAHSPDVVIADLSLPDGDGLDLVRALKQRYPDLPVLVVSMHDESLYAESALRAGASGYVMKHDPPEHVIAGLRKVLQGGLCVSPRMAGMLLNTYMEGPTRTHDRVGVQRLSRREGQVFECIGRGMTTREMAGQFGLSVKTIETYRGHIKRKLGLANNHGLVHAAIRSLRRAAPVQEREGPMEAAPPAPCKSERQRRPPGAAVKKRKRK